MHRLIRGLLGLLAVAALAAPAAAQDMVPPDQSFRTVGAWAVRVDKVTYGAGMESFRQELRTWVMIETTVRNTSATPQMFNASLFTSSLSDGSGTHTAPDGFTTHDQRTRGGAMGGAIGQPVAHVVPAGEERRAYFRYPVGDPAAQARLTTWTLVENNLLVMPGQRRERGRVAINLPRLTPPVPQTQATPTPHYDNLFADTWRVELANVRYTAPQPGRDTVVVTLKFTNSRSSQSAVLSKGQVNAAIHRRSGSQMSPYDFMLMEQGTQQSNDAAVAQGGQTVTAELYFHVGDEIAQRDVHQLTLRPRAYRNGRWEDSVGTPPVTVPLTPYAPSATPAPATTPIADAAATLQKYAGRYRTNRNTMLTLEVQGDVLTGEAMTLTYPSPRERVRLQLQPDGSVRGTMHDEVGRSRVGAYDLTLRFSPDGARFAGSGVQQHTDTPQNISYSGTREGAAGSTAAGNQKPGGDLPAGFVEAGFLAVRLDAVGRSTLHEVERIDVTLTVLNTQDDRRGVQYNDKTFVLITSDGAEYRWDGSYYGASSADRLVHTVWLEKDDQAQATYVFHAPADRTPARLSIREGSREIAALDLTKAPGALTTAPSGSATAASAAQAGQAATLTRFAVSLDRVQQDDEGAWEALVTVRNASAETHRLMMADLAVALYGQDGQARHMYGQFYTYASGPRRTVDSGMTLAPGAQTQVRLYFPQSIGMTPVRYRVRDREGRSAEGAVTR